MLVDLADGGRERLRFLQRLIDCFVAGYHLGELLRDVVPELLELGDVGILDAGVGNRGDGRVSDVGVRYSVTDEMRDSTCDRRVFKPVLSSRPVRAWCSG